METNTVVAAATGHAAKALEMIQSIGAEYGWRIIAALLILVVGMWIAKAIKAGFTKVMEKRKVDPTLTTFLASLIYIGLQAFIIIAALEKLNIRTASLITVLGAAGLAIGLALQGSLSNFASGVLMIIFRPFKVGDFVEAGGATGFVHEINIFTTIVNTPDHKKVIIPNSSVTGGNITNFNANGTRRIDLVAGISYSDDIDKAKHVLEDILAADQRILKNPEPTVAVVELGDSSVNLVVRPWVKGSDYWDIYFHVTESIKKRFDEEGISIPFPQRDVHLYEHKAD
jgi:small conductance mechanosensitive channel